MSSLVSQVGDLLYIPSDRITLVRDGTLQCITKGQRATGQSALLLVVDRTFLAGGLDQASLDQQFPSVDVEETEPFDAICNSRLVENFKRQGEGLLASIEKLPCQTFHPAHPITQPKEPTLSLRSKHRHFMTRDTGTL